MKLLRRGANPLRAAPSFVAHHIPIVSDVLRRTPPFLAFVLGIATLLTVILSLALCLDWRPATMSDIQIAARVRAAIPDPELLSQSDFVARLAIPADLGKLIAPLAATDPAMNVVDVSWIAALGGHVPLVVDPGRMAALGHLTTRLSAMPAIDQIVFLDRVLEIAKALQDQGTTQILHMIADLPYGARQTLASSKAFPNLIVVLSGLTEAQLSNLATVGLQNIPEDRNRAALLAQLPTLDPPVVRWLLRWQNANQSQRQVLILILEAIDGRDQKLSRLLTAYYVGNGHIRDAIQSLPTTCVFLNPGACR